MTVRYHYRKRLKVNADPFICHAFSLPLSLCQETATETLINLNEEEKNSAEYTKLNPKEKEVAWPKIKPSNSISKFSRFVCQKSRAKTD